MTSNDQEAAKDFDDKDGGKKRKDMEGSETLYSELMKEMANIPPVASTNRYAPHSWTSMQAHSERQKSGNRECQHPSLKTGQVMIHN
jgi:hypothetical protein